MKLERKHKTLIVLGIAALLIIYGLLDMMFKFNISEKTISNVSLVLVVVAFGLLFSGRNTKVNNSDDTKINDLSEETTNTTQVNNQLQGTNAEIDTNDQAQATIDETETSDSK